MDLRRFITPILPKTLYYVQLYYQASHVFTYTINLFTINLKQFFGIIIA